MSLALATLLLTAALWRSPIVLMVLLILTGAVMFAIRPSAPSIAVYVTAFVFGPVAEILSISTGAWTYESPRVLGVPIWLPFLWGNAGLFMLNTGELAKLILARWPSRARAVPGTVHATMGE